MADLPVLPAADEPVLAPQPAPGAAPRDMVWIPGGSFRMCSEDWFSEERPGHTVAVDGSWMDDH